jgi:hypothetical protein
MLSLIAVIIGLGLPEVAPPVVAVFSECDAGSDVIARVPRDASFTVHYSIDNGATCYLVTLSLADGRTARGYVVDRHIDAVVAFDKSRVGNEQNVFSARLPGSEVAAASVDAEKRKAAPAVIAQDEKKSAAKQPKLTW